MTPSFRAALAGLVPQARCLYEEPMKQQTTFRIGGPADVLVDVADAAEAQRVLALCQAGDMPVLVIGNGSNLLVADAGIRGVVMRIGNAMDWHRVTGDTMEAGAGMQLRKLARLAAENSLAGLAFAEGIPGTVGGGVAMNAGAYGGEMCQVVSGVTAVDPAGTLHMLDAGALRFSYRDSALLQEGWYTLSVRLQLRPGAGEDIQAEMRDYGARRKEKQPLEWPSAGSTFKRPVGGFASALIDEAGLKGTCVGGAQVSEKHAGFLINRGGATAMEMLRLMRQVRAAVLERSGIRLMPEVRLVGAFTPEEYAEWGE